MDGIYQIERNEDKIISYWYSLGTISRSIDGYGLMGSIDGYGAWHNTGRFASFDVMSNFQFSRGQLLHSL